MKGALTLRRRAPIARAPRNRRYYCDCACYYCRYYCYYQRFEHGIPVIARSYYRYSLDHDNSNSSNSEYWYYSYSSYYSDQCTPNLRGARSYQSMAGGSVATRGTSPSRAHEDAAVGDAAKGSARRHLPRLQRFLQPLRPRSRAERACACAVLNVHMCEARAVGR